MGEAGDAAKNLAFMKQGSFLECAQVQQLLLPI